MQFFFIVIVVVAMIFFKTYKEINGDYFIGARSAIANVSHFIFIE